MIKIFKFISLVFLKLFSFFLIGKLVIQYYGVDEFVIFNQLAQLSFFLIPIINLFLQLTLTKSIAGELIYSFNSIFKIIVAFLIIFILVIVISPSIFINNVSNFTGVNNKVFEIPLPFTILFIASLGLYGILNSVATGLSDSNKLINFELTFLLGMLAFSFIGFYLNNKFILRYASFLGFLVTIIVNIRYLIKSVKSIPNKSGKNRISPYFLSSIIVSFSVPLAQIFMRGNLYKLSANDAATFTIVQKFSSALIIPLAIYVSQIENPKFFAVDFSRSQKEWHQIILKLFLFGLGLIFVSLFFIKRLVIYFSNDKVDFNIFHFCVFALAEVIRMISSLFSFYYNSRGHLYIFILVEMSYTFFMLVLIKYCSSNLDLFYTLYLLLTIILIAINLFYTKKELTNEKV